MCILTNLRILVLNNKINFLYVGGARVFTGNVWRSWEGQEISFILWNGRFIAFVHDRAKYLLFSIYVINLLPWQLCWKLPLYPSNTHAVMSIILHILRKRKNSIGVRSFFLPHDIFRIMILDQLGLSCQASQSTGKLPNITKLCMRGYALTFSFVVQLVLSK